MQYKHKPGEGFLRQVEELCISCHMEAFTPSSVLLILQTITRINYTPSKGFIKVRGGVGDGGGGGGGGGG